jgi:predicted porin
MQKKLIAAAVAGALATPLAIADVAVSGSVRGAVKYNGASSEWTMGNAGSRLRFKANSDLGNGQSAFMNYEFGVDSGLGSIQTGKTSRLAYVGIKGDWGSMSLGAQWSTMFNVVGTYIDKSNIYGGLGYWGNGSGPYRNANSVYVSTNVGGFGISADAVMASGGDDIDAGTIGTNINVGAVSMGLAYGDHSNGQDMTGIGAAINLAGIGLSGGWTDVSNVGSGMGVNAKLAGVMVAYEDSDSYADPRIWGNYSVGLGGGAKVIVEIMNDGTDTHGATILRMDF